MIIGAIPAAIGATVAMLLPLVDRFMPDMSLYVKHEELSRELKSRDAEWARASLECSTALAKAGAAESLSREAKSQCDALNVLYQSMQSRPRRR